MVKCVVFEVWVESLNMIQTSFGFQGLIAALSDSECDILHAKGNIV
jgi:hypothetical protein